jgi:hypothetical protein
MNRNELLERWCNGEVTKETAEQFMDSTDPQPATSEMLCGFVLGAICAGLCLWVWNLKF